MLGINKDSAVLAAKQGVTNLIEYEIQPGDLIWPNHIVCQVGDSKEAFYFNGGPDGVAIPGSGEKVKTILAEYDEKAGGDPNQERVFGGRGDGAGLESDVLPEDQQVPIPPVTGVKINWQAPKVQQSDE